MDYIIERVIGIYDAPNPQWGKKAKFILEGYDGEVSALTKFPDDIVAGKKITGTIDVVTREGRTYHNFKFGRSNATPNPMPHQPGNAEIKNIIELKLIPMLQHIEAHLDRIEKYVTGEEVETKKLDTTFEDKIQPDDIPF
jgi:hypothetical protein